MNTARRDPAVHDERPDAAPQHRALVVVAAGEGRRLGHGMPKALVPLRGAPLLTHALRGSGGVRLDVVVLVLPAEESARRELAAIGRAHQDRTGRTVMEVVGGATRAASVGRGLQAVEDHAAAQGWSAEQVSVLVHDAARPLVPSGVFARVLGAVESGAPAVVPALPVTDTIKRVDSAEVTDGRLSPVPDGEPIAATVPRADLRAVQTPQGYRLETLRRIHAHLEGLEDSRVEAFTDEAMVAEHLGLDCLCVPGDPLAAKITGPSDLITLAALQDAAEQQRTGGETGMTEPRASEASQSSQPQQTPGGAPSAAIPLVGIGHDVHAFAASEEQRPLHLAGLHWPGERGLTGHSDGDAVAHAACDALFGAAGIGDLGVHFGTTRPELAGASGPKLLAEAARLVVDAGFAIGSINVQLVANRPKFGPRREEAQQVLSEAAGAPVALSATTTDGLGLTGRGEGVLATAVAVVVRAETAPAPEPAAPLRSEPGRRHRVGTRIG